MAIRVLLVDDHPLFLRGVLGALAPASDVDVVDCAATGKRALELYRNLLPDVTVMDISLTPEMTGIATIVEICRQSPAARIIVLSALDDEETICAAIQAGAA